MSLLEDKVFRVFPNDEDGYLSFTSGPNDGGNVLLSAKDIEDDTEMDVPQIREFAANLVRIADSIEDYRSRPTFSKAS